jgi:hypothetical protein
MFAKSSSFCLVTFFLLASACSDEVTSFPVSTASGTGGAGAGQGGTSTTTGGAGPGGSPTGGGGSTGDGGGGGVQNGVPCPDTPCDPGEICCVLPDPGNTTYECIPSDGACNGFALGCDGPEDCPGGECCSDGVSNACSSGPTCDPGSLGVCHHSADCGPNETCCGGHGGTPTCMVPQGQLCIEACLDANDCEPNELCCPSGSEMLCSQTSCQ